MKNKFTKTATLIIMFMVMLQSVYSQNYLITFSGSGQSTTVETIEVKNITQQTTLILSGTDTLLLTDVVGTGDMPAMNQGMIVYPNPANHSSRLEFYNSSAGNTRGEIYDFSGRLVIHKSMQLEAGSHTFSISGLKAGIYLIKVNTAENTYSHRLVSTSVQGLSPELQYEGITQIRQQKPDLKSTSNIMAMQYNDGERLVFKAISGDYAHTKSLVPTESQNMDFEFMDCIDGYGNHYDVVTIGEQVWMAENLKTTQYRNGTPIEYPGNNNSAWENNTTGAYAWYDNDISWKDSYGALYNWHAVYNNSGLCPEGWHIPDISVLIQLVDYLIAQGFPNEFDDPNGAGAALKSCRQVNSPLGGDCNTSDHPRWDEVPWSPYHHGFDAFGLSGLPGGYRNIDGMFSSPGDYSPWWSSTEHSIDNAGFWSLFYSGSNVNFDNSYDKHYGLSVRCLRNSDAPSAEFTAEPISGTAPLTVSFTDQSSNNPTSWQWTFGDGGSSTQQNPAYTYQNPGSYTVELTVTNSFGSDTEIKTDYIIVTSGGIGEPCPGVPTVTDIDGNVYSTVLIGNQCWMKENLKTTQYRNGTPIEYPGTNNSAWENNTTGAYAWYDNDISWKDSYGALYNWHAVINANGLCPTGWYMPGDNEWTQLVDYVVAQGFPNQFDDPNGAGNALKSCRQENSPYGGDCNTSDHPRWDSHITQNGFDEFGFSGLPGGGRGSWGPFGYIGSNGTWWSSTESSTLLALVRGLDCNGGHAPGGESDKGFGYSVRCLRDSDAPSAAFTAEPTSGTAPLTVSFTDQSSNNPTSWQWTFGDGGSSTQQNPAHTYQNPGSYTVELTVTNSYGSDTEIKTDYIIVTSGGNGEPCPGVPTVTDIDGNVYNTVLIGEQCWMKENLKTTTYSNATAIPNVTDANAWGSLTTGAYVWYDNDISWKDSYGALYNWHAVNNTNGLCPTGWHVPIDAELTQLVDYVVSQGFPNSNVINGAGNALKSCRQVNSPLGGGCNTTEHPRWESHSTHYGFDEFGFSGLPGGSRFTSGAFYAIGYYSTWWSSTETSAANAWYRFLFYYDGNVTSDDYDKTGGFSVRCLKDYVRTEVD